MHNNNGESIIEPGTILLTDCASIHSGSIQDILHPYLEDIDIEYFFIPKFSPDCNPTEEYFSLLKHKLKDPYYQTWLKYSVPTAVLSAAESISANMVHKFFKIHCVTL